MIWNWLKLRLLCWALDSHDPREVKIERGSLKEIMTGSAKVTIEHRCRRCWTVLR